MVIYIYKLIATWKDLKKQIDLLSCMIAPLKKRITATKALENEWIVEASSASDGGTIESRDIILMNLRKFQSAELLKQTVLTYLSTQITEAETEEIVKTFKALDVNSDGKLSREEMKVGLLKSLKLEEIDELLSSIDTDKSGYINYNGKSANN